MTALTSCAGEMRRLWRKRRRRGRGREAAYLETGLLLQPSLQRIFLVEVERREDSVNMPGSKM
eukprot:445111-Hanusia_phi.AAC.1